MKIVFNVSTGLSLAAVPFLILMNAFFVAGEYAVVSVRPAQIASMRAAGRKRAADAIEALKEDAASAIGAIQVCITMTNLMLGWIGEPAMSAVLRKAFGPLIEWSPKVFTTFSTVMSFIIVTLLTVVFSELLPKALTLRYAIAAAVLTSRPILAIRKVTKPLVWLMNFMANMITVPLRLGRVEESEEEQITPAELRLLTAKAVQSGSLSTLEHSLILNSLSVASKRVKEIMVHRTKVVYVDMQRTMADNRDAMDSHLYSRLPLCDGGLDKIIGVISTKEFLTLYHDAADNAVLPLLAAKAIFIPETIRVDAALRVFKKSRQQFGIVVDEFGGVEGILTLQDVVDELLTDPPDVKELSGKTQESETSPASAKESN